MPLNNTKIIDNHVHVGWFKDGYHPPIEIWTEVRAAGVDDIAVSSTSICAELYKLVIREIKSLKRLGQDHVHPILWLTPRMLKTYGLRKMLHAKINWEGVKIHSEAHHEWAHNPILVKKAVAIAQELHVPMLIHTGNFTVSKANVFEYLYQEFPKQTFVLAHGRPLNQVLAIMSKYPNVIVDTAFMPVEDIRELISHHFLSRIAWGTDVPINRTFYPNIRTRDYILDVISEMKHYLNAGDFNTIIKNSIYSANKK